LTVALEAVGYGTAMRWAWLMVVIGLATACAAVPSPSPSAAEPSASAPVQAGFPAGCAPVELVSRTGERVDLTGEWAGSGILTITEDEVARLNEVGGCVYGSVTGLDGNGEEAVTNLSGRVRPEFTIELEVVIIRAAAFAFGEGYGFAEYSPMVMLIEWDDDGRLRLREDRDPGSRADRCVQPTIGCPSPVIWYRLDDAPPP